MTADYEGKDLLAHPDEPILRFFAWQHLPLTLQDVSRPFGELALFLVDALPRSAERTVALRKLLEGKDAAVRAALPPPPAYPLIPKSPALGITDTRPLVDEENAP
jgi:hypothetical protein